MTFDVGPSTFDLQIFDFRASTFDDDLPEYGGVWR